jgi:hypothetical protein
MFKETKILIALTLCLIIVVPSIVLAETIGSTNYNIEDATLDGGGEPSSSTNYSSRDSISSEESGDSSSTNYKNPSGFQTAAYPGVPATPTLTNTGGTLYNSLDFVVATGDGQQSDTTYAIAISSDDFTTTNFIQTDGTVGTSEAWQSYTGWNSGTGERVTGLTPSTTYKIKVKASYGSGSNAADSESGYSQIASASTSSPSLTVSISGVSSGSTVAGATTTVTSTVTNIAFGSLTIGDGSPNVAAQNVTVSTNATGGYTSTVAQNQNLTSTNGDTIASVSGTNSSPAAFDTGVTTGRFGYHTTDSSLCTGTGNRFSSNDTYAALTTSHLEIACSTGPVTNEVTTVVYKLVIGNLQEAGDYQNTVTYITTATY